MRLITVEESKKIWQVVAEAYRSPNNPYARYAPDVRIGLYHLATLALNFDADLHGEELYNPFTLDFIPGGFTLAVPGEAELASFPNLNTFEEIAAFIGYVPYTESGQPWQDEPVSLPQEDVPQWVKTFILFAQERRRELAGEIPL